MIQMKNLSFHYKKSKPLFSGLDLQMEPGHIYGFLGKNGAGKTTLMKIISGLLFPQSGELDVLGYTPKYRRPDFLADVYLVPEEGYVPDMSIANFYKVYAPFYPKFNRELFESCLSDFEVPMDGHLKGLSFGQKKKVMLSFGLATNSKLLIMDEPTNGLDIPSKKQFRKMMARSISDDQTFVISTHQVKDLTNLIDTIIILDNSKILLSEGVDSISEKLHFGYAQGMDVPENTFYTERVPGGHVFVKKNTTGEESEVEIESLFNAVMDNKAAISKLFKN